MRIGLRDDGLDRFLDERPPVPRGYHDGYKGLCAQG
jgi:hypothetical protein